MFREECRRLVRSPFAYLTRLGVVGAGTAIAAAAFTVLSLAILRPLPYPNADRTFGVWDAEDPEGRMLSHDVVRRLLAAGGPVRDAASYAIADFSTADQGVGPSSMSADFVLTRATWCSGSPCSFHQRAAGRAEPLSRCRARASQGRHSARYSGERGPRGTADRADAPGPRGSGRQPGVVPPGCCCRAPDRSDRGRRLRLLRGCLGEEAHVFASQCSHFHALIARELVLRRRDFAVRQAVGGTPGAIVRRHAPRGDGALADASRPNVEHLAGATRLTCGDIPRSAFRIPHSALTSGSGLTSRSSSRRSVCPATP
jgi:hypothetical protein